MVLGSYIHRVLPGGYQSCGGYCLWLQFITSGRVGPLGLMAVGYCCKSDDVALSSVKEVNIAD